MLLLGFILLGLAWLLPGHYFPWPSAHQEFVASAGGCLIVGAIVASRSHLLIPRTAWFILFVALIPIAQGAIGQIAFFSDALLASLYLLVFGLAVIAGNTLMVRRPDDLLDGLTATFIVGAVFSTGLAAFQWQHLSTLGIFLVDFQGDRPYANLAQPNQLATLLAWGMIGIWRWYEMHRIRGTVASAAMAWIGFGMIMTQSRTVWIFLAAVFCGYMLVRRRSMLRTRLSAVVGGVLFFVLGILCWGPLNAALDLDAVSLARRLEPGIRQVLWASLLHASFEAPWFGYGWTQVGLAQQITASAYPPVYSYFRESHNIILDLVLWNGWPLAIFIVAMIYSWTYNQLRVCRTVNHCALLLALTAVTIHAMVEYPLEYVYFLLPAGLMVGAVSRLPGVAASGAVPYSVFSLLSAAVVSVFIIISVEYFRLEEAGRDVRFRAARIGLSHAPIPEPDVMILKAELEYQRFIRAEPRSGMTTDELQWFRKVAHRNAHASAQLKLARALAMNMRGAEATETLVVLCKIHRPRQCADAAREWLEEQEAEPKLRGLWPALTSRQSIQ